MRARHSDGSPGSSRRQRGASIAWALLAIALAALAWQAVQQRSTPAMAERQEPPAETAPPAGSSPGAAKDPDARVVQARGDLAQDERNNIEVFRNVSPSVVHITTLQAARGMFSRDLEAIPSGTGTGFLWDTNGHVVTNFHVVQSGDAAQVTLSDQSVWKARFVGAFPDRDLAVLRIDPPRDRIRPITLGSSADLQVGQRVYAIGNPFGLDQTLTTGIVSALDREIQSVTQRSIRGVIQTDAAINPGNSGGPLLDSAGRLIGVNTAIYSPSGASAGIGFAIPVDEVNRIVPRLIRDGRFIRPSLGIQAGPRQLARALGLPEGIVIVGVASGSPAAKAGLRAFRRAADGSLVRGDVLLEIDGERTANFDDLLSILERRQAGDAVRMKVLRDGRPLELTATLGKGD
ncbi:MAG: putative DegP protease [Pseudomonadota bacterium]|jgi:S1-C subfamily serine protease